MNRYGAKKPEDEAKLREKVLNFEKSSEEDLEQEVPFLELNETDVKKSLTKRKKREAAEERESQKEKMGFGELNPTAEGEEDNGFSDEQEVETSDEEKYIVNDILSIGRHTQITAAGRVYSFSALVMIGTGRGSAALGYGRGESVPEAIDMSKLNAENNMLTLKLYRGSVGADIYRHYKKSRAFILAKIPGHGVTASYEMKRILEAFGITDVTIAVGGSKNVNTRYRSVWLGLRDGVRNPEDVARLLGRKLLDRDRAYYYKGE